MLTVAQRRWHREDHAGDALLAAGIANGEQRLFICLGESAEGIREDARATGFDLAGVHLSCLSPDQGFLAKMETCTYSHRPKWSGCPQHRGSMDQVEKPNSCRISVDSLTQFRCLSTDALQFRRQASSFLRFLIGRGASLSVTKLRGFDFHGGHHFALLSSTRMTVFRYCCPQDKVRSL